MEERGEEEEGVDPRSLALVLYTDAQVLEETLPKGSLYERSLHGRPWMYRSPRGLTYCFCVAPTLAQVDGVVAVYSQFGSVYLVGLLAHPKPTEPQQLAALACAHRFGLDSISLVESFVDDAL